MFDLIKIVYQRNLDFWLKKGEWGWPQDEKSRPVAFSQLFEETTNETDFYRASPKQRKIIALQTTSEILRVNIY